ncbi:uncharacterized protein LOC62_07G009218 [Vanrija pseudolonga]|nr:hypothetical protein LOC62_07G009218 [Vanrija pseudolonga]WOO85726.1 hypothetical protein LOC62_07G009218 [Vanrija pseudolonga]
MVHLLLFSGVQAPLQVRYSRPAKPKYDLPPLVHRALHTALDSKPASASYDAGADLLIIPRPGTLHKHSWDACSLADYDVTVKIQIVNKGTAASYAAEVSKALQTLAEHKGLELLDTVLVGLPKDEPASTWVEFWKTITSGEIKDVKNWGTLNLLEPILAELVTIKAPVANELNTTDCYTLPQDYTAFASSHRIQLWASGGGAGPDPLPAADLHNLLHEFKSVLGGLVPAKSTPALSSIIPVAADGSSFCGQAKPDVAVDWVVTYTLLSRTRNIVKDKGYIVSAESA